MSKDSHIDFLNRYYGAVAWTYDFTRKYFLLGRDQLLTMMIADQYSSYLDIGAGTGRNLKKLHRAAKNSVKFGAIEPCAPLLDKLKANCDFVTIRNGLAEDFSIPSEEAPDCIYFSYSLSMVESPDRAIENALKNVRPGGAVFIVDFGGFRGFPRVFQSLMRKYLATFRVFPDRIMPILESHVVARPKSGYYVIAKIPKKQ